MEPIAYANGSTTEDPAITYGIVFSNFMGSGVYTFQGGSDQLIAKMVDELRRNGVELRKKVLEAMANQVPVVATELDLGTCHYFDAGRNILLMGEPSAFAQTVAALRDDPERWLSLVESGRATVEEHASWEGFARAMRGQIEALLLSGAGRSEHR
jgi:glycosyltransferase involved in cell wall biosynthesis